MQKEELNKITGSNLRRLRESHGYTQEKLSELTGITSTNISEIERGIRGIGPKSMQLLCDALGVRPVDLFYEASTPVISDAEERELIETIRKHPEIKHDLVKIGEALAAKYTAQTGEKEHSKK